METERRSSVDVKAIKKLLMRVVSGDVMHVILDDYHVRINEHKRYCCKQDIQSRKKFIEIDKSPIYVIKATCFCW